MTRRLLLHSVFSVLGGLFSLRGVLEPVEEEKIPAYTTINRLIFETFIVDLDPANTPFMTSAQIEGIKQADRDGLLTWPR